jgi:Uma2 family endonuclease
MASQTVSYIHAEEYLNAERKAAWKSEYYDGQIYKMAGARPRHTRIATNLAARLLLALDGGPCQVFNSDMRVHIPATGLYTYPDVSVVCGEPVFVQSDNLANPILVIEVLSKSTKRYDRTEKFLHYQSLSSLKEYLLVSHDPRLITHCTRLGGEDWRIETVDNDRGSIALSCIGVEITFDHMYAGVNSLPR